jgi:SAM-dependent methyltransferase
VGIDIDPKTIWHAEEQFGGDGVEFLVDDCEQLSQVTDPFGLICCFENIEHLCHPERFLDAAGRLLGPGGLLLISTPDRASTPPFVNGRPSNKFHRFEWYRDEFHALLSRHLAEVEMRTQVETTSLRSRIEAVSALRQAFKWSNPMAAFILWWWPFGHWRQRSWKKLADLAAPSIGDYPIVSLANAALFGTSAFHLASCSQPKSQAK